MGILSLFKKKPAKTPEPVVKIVEKEVKIPSRFTFAYDYDEIDVAEFYLNLETRTAYSALEANTAFIIDGIYGDKNNAKIYPVFIMPRQLPSTKLVTPKKVMCVGTIVTQHADSKIRAIGKMFTGLSLDQVMTLLNLTDSAPTEATDVFITNRDDIIMEKIIEGDICFATLSNFCILNNNINLITND